MPGRGLIQAQGSSDPEVRRAYDKARSVVEARNLELRRAC